MSYSHYVRCPECHKISVTENLTPIEMLMEGLTNVTIHCPHCGLREEYLELSADEFEKLAVSDEEAEQLLRSS